MGGCLDTNSMQFKDYINDHGGDTVQPSTQDARRRRKGMSYPQESFISVSLEPGSLLNKRREAAYINTLPYQLDVLKSTGRYDAFRLGWHESYNDRPDVWPIPNHLFWDSDVAKWIEGACYFLREKPNQEVESAVNELVDMIVLAQQPDGYINIHYTVVEPGKRFTNLRDMHELYNLGHLIEAALAHHALFKNERFLGPVLRYVGLLCDTFGPGVAQTHGYPGHPEIELALLRLYNRVERYDIWKLAEYFIRERGNPQGEDGKHYYIVEAERRGDDPNQRPAYWPDSDSLWYYQAHKPIFEQESIEGHSVRAMYLLTATADLVHTQTSMIDGSMLSAVKKLWRNMVDRKMYLTGGIGAIKQWEGFGVDYFLPQGTDEGGCYSETCAAIGVMMLAQRLLQIETDGEYGDIMELCLYNTVLGSMSNDGKRFTYVNQLASSDQDLSQRQAWFTCACCPPNVLRLLGQIGGYATSVAMDPNEDAASIYIDMFVSCQLKFNIKDEAVVFSQKSEWPWSGLIECSLLTSLATIEVSFRVPQWAGEVTIEPPCPGLTQTNGYVFLPSSWLSKNPTFKIFLPLEPRIISPHPSTNQQTVSIARGPIIYCVEDYDNPWVQDHFQSIQLDAQCRIEELLVTDAESGEKYVRLTVKEGASQLQAPEVQTGSTPAGNALPETETGVTIIKDLHFVPYYFRANRGGNGQMRVGLRRWVR